jgi:cytochrome c553
MRTMMTRLRMPQALSKRGWLAGTMLIGLALGCGRLQAADATPAGDLGAQIATSGTDKGAPPCSACHGANGEGQDATGFPRLAGLNAAYITRQLVGFGDGSRSNETMTPIASILTTADRDAVAKYYAALPAPNPPPNPARSTSLLNAAGEALAQRGAWDAGVPACASCHGPQGTGVGASFPPLAGQPSAYIVNQLNAWRDGSRRNDPMGLMHGVATHLSDSQIADVAAYYAALPAHAAASNASPTSPKAARAIQ